MALQVGDTHAVLQSSNGKLFTFGYNDYGQCGSKNFTEYVHPKIVGLDEQLHPDNNTSQIKRMSQLTGFPQPTPIPKVTRVSQISSG